MVGVRAKPDMRLLSIVSDDIVEIDNKKKRLELITTVHELSKRYSSNIVKK